ncbi:uncharacterized protein BXZ73DRAFT_110935 [Epithele typhae]|uniref:uncharacterized protein n=1 Tax=Epithele typhae TaxID=378194 RepID=UPI00200869C7|nr:uncharacterized protein BXZ73DRAFT_110935 [Epithele typhae]KAH9905511.1 hypothetical protein BXZ73DRAFT_110935 [Epithele typhae]
MLPEAAVISGGTLPYLVMKFSAIIITLSVALAASARPADTNPERSTCAAVTAGRSTVTVFATALKGSSSMHVLPVSTL